ncbi:MAG TPA: hypothetical protein VF345_08515 [Chthoniobacterales bacterium]
MSVRQFVNDWLERKAPEVAEATLGFYRNAADKFLGFLGTAVDEDLTEITRDHITQFRNQEAKRFAPKTFGRENTKLEPVTPLEITPTVLERTATHTIGRVATDRAGSGHTMSINRTRAVG